MKENDRQSESESLEPNHTGKGTRTQKDKTGGVLCKRTNIRSKGRRRGLHSEETGRLISQDFVMTTMSSQ